MNGNGDRVGEGAPVRRWRLTGRQRDDLVALSLDRLSADRLDQRVGSALDRSGLIVRRRRDGQNEVRLTNVGRRVADLIVEAERRGMLDDGPVLVEPGCREVNRQYVTPWEEID